MFILTRSEPLENCKDNVYRVYDADLEAKHLEAGHQRYERRYQIKDKHKVFTIVCPEYRKDAICAEPIVIIPVFYVPGRPYPIYVYLFAIDLYSSNPKKSQRWAAGETRKHFGLETFAHTTLGRALKAFVQNISETASEQKEADAMLPDPSVGEKPSFPKTQATAGLRKQAAQLLGGLLAKGNRKQSIDAGCRLAKQWYAEHRRLLL